MSDQSIDKSRTIHEIKSDIETLESKWNEQAEKETKAESTLRDSDGLRPDVDEYNDAINAAQEAEDERLEEIEELRAEIKQVKARYREEASQARTPSQDDSRLAVNSDDTRSGSVTPRA